MTERSDFWRLHPEAIDAERERLFWHPVRI